MHGLAGGYVLADGHLAPDAPGDAAYRSGIAPWDRDEHPEPVARPLTAAPEPLELALVDLAREQGSVTAAQAAAALAVATGRRPTTKAARRHLDRLEAAGHLTREPARADGRRRIGRWTATKPPRRGQRWQPRRKNRRRWQR